jgi:hypothetical protein
MNQVETRPRVRYEEHHDDNAVVVLAWPEAADRIVELAHTGRPRLLLVAADAEPPADWDRMTDWVRLPVDDRDFHARVRELQRRAERHAPPRLDEFDVLWRGSVWCALAPIEARIVETMLNRFGAVVTRRELGAAAWPAGMPTERAVDARLTRLRRRIEPLGLQIHNVRRRGLRLDVGDVPATGAGPDAFP